MRHRLLRLSVWTVCLLFFAIPATAASESGGEGSSDFVFQVVNFLILIGVLVYVGRKPMKGFFEERRDSILTQLSDASELHRQAEESHARWQRQLVELEGEVAQIRDVARDRAERESTQILADAEATAQRIKRDAVAAIDQELLRAQRRLRAETSDLAVELASGILRAQVTEHDRGRLLDEFITRIEQAPRSAHSSGTTIGSSS